MPPHCDSLDGPVVMAATDALVVGDFDTVAAYVPAKYEEELHDAFDLVVKARRQGAEACAVAERYFFETAVRLHRAGEGASFEGLKPAGLDVGPVIPLAERAIEDGNPDDLVQLLSDELAAGVRHRLERVSELREGAADGIEAARSYITACLDLQVWSHTVFKAMHSAGHGAGHHH